MQEPLLQLSSLMENFIRVYPKALSEVECDSLVADWDNFPRPLENEDSRFNMSAITHRNDSLIRLDAVYESDTLESQALKIKYFKTIEKVLVKERDNYLNDLGQDNMFPLNAVGFQVQKYKASKGGGYHVFHYERHGSSPDKEAVKRQLVWMIYLNDVPEGEGETEFLYQGLRVQPKKGDLVLWPSAFTHTHRGNPVYTTDKYIVTGWFNWPST